MTSSAVAASPVRIQGQLERTFVPGSTRPEESLCALRALGPSVAGALRALV